MFLFLERIKSWKRGRRVLRAKELLSTVVQDDESGFEDILGDESVSDALNKWARKNFADDHGWLLGDADVDKLLSAIQKVPLGRDKQFKLLKELLRAFQQDLLATEDASLRENITKMVADVLTRDNLLDLIESWQQKQKDQEIASIAYIAGRQRRGLKNSDIFKDAAKFDEMLSQLGYPESHVKKLLVDKLEREEFVQVYKEKYNLSSGKESLMRMIRDWENSSAKSGFEVISFIANKHLEGVTNRELFSSLESIREMLSATGFKEGHLRKLIVDGFSSNDLISLLEKKHEDAQNEFTQFLLANLKAPHKRKGKRFTEDVISNFRLSWEDTAATFAKELKNVEMEERSKVDADWLETPLGEVVARFDQASQEEWIGSVVNEFLNKDSDRNWNGLIGKLKKITGGRYSLAQIVEGNAPQSFGEKISLTEIVDAYSISVQSILQHYENEVIEFIKSNGFKSESEWLEVSFEDLSKKYDKKVVEEFIRGQGYKSEIEWLETPLGNLLKMYDATLVEAFRATIVKDYLEEAGRRGYSELAKRLNELTDRNILLVEGKSGLVSVHGEKIRDLGYQSEFNLLSHLIYRFSEKNFLKKTIESVERDNRFSEVLNKNQLMRFFERISCSNPQVFSEFIQKDFSLLEKVSFTKQNSRHWDKSSKLYSIYKSTPGFTESLSNDPEISDALSKDEAFLNKVLTSNYKIQSESLKRAFSKRIQKDKGLFEEILHNSALFEEFWRKVEKTCPGMELNRFPYFLVSYPRSGSNFIQNLLKRSTGFSNQSIYSPLVVNHRMTMTLKTHSPTPSYLKQEADGMIGLEKIDKSRFIILLRDPRDIMISFYEYVKARRNIQLAQSDFLNGVDFFYASTIDKQFARKLNFAPMNVVQAYRMFVRNWIQFSNRNKVGTLVIKYEDLLRAPKREFSKILKFTGQRVELKNDALGEMVSLYSDEERPRGKAYGWKKLKKEYGTLINEVEDKLSKELELLGYK